MSPISFTFHVSLDWNHMNQYETINGFYVHLTDPFSEFGRPIAVPAGMHAFIEMSQPTLRVDRSKCFNAAMPNTILGPYDSRGYLCKIQKYFEGPVQKYAGCQFAFGAFVPNETNSCSGAYLLPQKMSYTYGVRDNRFEESYVSVFGDYLSLVGGGVRGRAVFISDFLFSFHLVIINDDPLNFHLVIINENSKRLH